MIGWYCLINKRVRYMKTITAKSIAVLLLAALLLSFSSCFKKTVWIKDSGWKFESMEANGTKLTAEDFSADQIPVFICDKNNNVFLYYNGVIRSGRLAGNVNYTYLLDFSDSEKYIDAFSSGDKLTVYFDDSKDSKMTFRATEEISYIPVVDETEGSYQIDVKSIGNGAVEFTNMDDETWYFGEYYKLEVLRGDTWYYVPYTEPYIVHDLGHELAPGQSMDFTYDMHFFGTLEPGDYRLSVGDLGNRTNVYYAYFKVNADGTYSYDK